MKSSIFWALGICTCFLLVIGALIFFKTSATMCYDMPEKEARGMVERILEDKISRSGNGRVLYGYDASHIAYRSYRKDLGVKGDGFSSVELNYFDSISGGSLFIARIFETCEVEWIDMRNEINGSE